jgi:hypothetical protein
MSVTHTRIPEHPCPGCSKPIDEASGLRGRPRPGDLSVCYYCGAPWMFDSALQLRPLDLEPKLADDIRLYQMKVRQ